MINITKVDWALIMTIAGGIVAGALSIGKLQGVVNTLDPEVIKEKKDIAIQEIKQAGIEARKSLNKNVATPILEIDKLVTEQKKLENSFKEMKVRLDVLADENKGLLDKVANIKRVENPSGSDERIYVNKFSTFETEMANLKNKYKMINERLSALSVIDKNDYIETKGLVESNRKEINNVEKKLEEISNFPEADSMEGYYKLPITPEEGKRFSPPLKKAITLCNNYFYLTYNGFWNKKSNAHKVAYTMSYDSGTTNKYIDPGEAELFRGKDRKLTLIYIELSDDRKNPIFEFKCE